jgi:hypothetical protein
MTQINSTDLVPNTPIKTGDPILEIVMDTGAPLRVGQHTFSLVVADDSGNVSQTATVEVIIRDGQAPTAVLDVLPSRTLSFGQSFTLSAERSSDVGGQIESYTWTLVSRQ